MNNVHVMSSGMDDGQTLNWREPTQKRSREKVDRILDAAISLAIETGALDLKMTDIAKTAGVAVGTLYQFFPSRTALIGKLFSREMAPIDESMMSLFTTPVPMSDMSGRVEALIADQLAIVRSRPGLAVIWSAPSVLPEIAQADFENTQQNAARLADQIRISVPGSTSDASLHATTLLICHVWSAVIRLCLLSGENRSPEIIRQYARMIVEHCQSLIRPDP